MADKRKRCFVLMGFGVKVDHKTKRSLDLDKTYRIIRAAVEGAGLECIRADDIVHAGVIDKAMYENLLTADLAIADLSTSNENAIYELGVRHALRPHTTIVIAEKQFAFPFDLKSLVIRPYEHLGTGIDFEEAERLKAQLTSAITTILATEEVDSPVYTFLPQLRPPLLDRQPATRGQRRPLAPAAAAPGSAADATFSVLLDAFREARQHGDFALARAYVSKLRESKPDDPYLIQQHALATYKIEPLTRESLQEAREILQRLQPSSSADPETLGLWGGIHKRLWEVSGERAALDEGIWAYERGFYMKRDHYNGVNFAYMLDERARLQADPDEATADRVLARRVRRQLLAIVDETVKALPRGEDHNAQDVAEWYWLEATRLEALLGLGDPSFEQVREEVFKAAPEPWMKTATERQLDRLAAVMKS